MSSNYVSETKLRIEIGDMPYGTVPLAHSFQQLHVAGPRVQSLGQHYNHPKHRLHDIEIFQTSSQPSIPAIGRPSDFFLGTMPMEQCMEVSRVDRHSCPACCQWLTSSVTEVSHGHAARCPTCDTETASLASSMESCLNSEDSYASNKQSSSLDTTGSNEQEEMNAPIESTGGWEQLQGLRCGTVKGLKRKVEETDTYYGRNKQRNLISEQEADRWRIENKRVPIFLKGSSPATSHHLLQVRPYVDTVLDLQGIVERELGLPFSAYFLVYQGKLLNPERKLAEVGIGQNSTVLVTIRGPPGMGAKPSGNCRNSGGSDLWTLDRLMAERFGITC